MIIKMFILLLFYKYNEIIDYKEYKEVLNELLNEYNDNKWDNYLKRNNRSKNILKCISVFMIGCNDIDNLLDIMVKKCKMELIYDFIENDKIFLNRNYDINIIYYYIHKRGIEDRENEIINEIIKDETKRKKIKYRRIKSADYDGDLFNNENGILKPRIDGDVEEFSLIEASLPDMFFNIRNGEIIGKVHKSYSGHITISIKNVWDEIHYKMEKICWEYDNNYSCINKAYKKGMKTEIFLSYRRDYYRRTFYDIKMEKGVYHFIFYTSTYSTQVGGVLDSYHMKYNKCGKFCEVYLHSYNLSKCNIGVEINNYPKNVDLHKFEVLFDMNNKIFSIKDVNGENIILFTNIPSGLNLYTCTSERGVIELSKWWVNE